MEIVILLVVLGLAASYVYAAGKRTGARKGFGAGRSRR